MDAEHGLDLPRRLQIEFSKVVQQVTETTGTEIRPGELWDVFSRTYLDEDAGIRLISSEVSSGGRQKDGENTTRVTAQVLVDGEHRTIVGAGNGPVEALVNGIRDSLGIEMTVQDYSQHALSAGSEASAVAYVEAEGVGEARRWGVGMDSSILDASLGRGDQRRQPPAGARIGSEAATLGLTRVSDIQPEEEVPPRGHVRVVYLGPVAPHWRIDSDFGDRNVIEDFRQRVQARLLLLPPHDPQFRRNRERVARDAERENLLLDWDLGLPDDDET